MTQLAKTSVSKLSINTLYDVRSRSSFCWKYFGSLIVTDGKKKIINSDQVYCLACLSAIKEESDEITFGSAKIKSYNKTVSTGNLIRHLRDSHRIRDEPGHDAKVRTTTSSTPGRHDKWFLAKDLALWFCKSLLPFDSICDEGMVDFFKKYNIIATDEDIPSRYTVSSSALSEVYESMVSKAKEIISIDGASHVSISFDSWTDQYRRLNYITFTLHYLTSDFTLKTFTLRTEIIDEEKANEKLKNVIENIRNDFALNDKKNVAVTDVGSKRAVSLTDMTHHPCLGHGLHNLVTVDGIKSVPEIEALVQKCTHIVKAVRHRVPQLHADAKKARLQLEFLDSLDRVVEAIESDVGDPIPQIEWSQSNTLTHTDDRTSISVSGDHKHILQVDWTAPDPLTDVQTSSSVSTHYNRIPQVDWAESDPLTNTDEQTLPSVSEDRKPIIIQDEWTSVNLHINSEDHATPTRWHSILEMLESVNHVCDRSPINKMLTKIGQEKLKLSQSEWILLGDLVVFLRSFREAVEIMSSQKTCTINVALVFRSEIIDVLNTFQENESLMMLRLKSNMLANIDKRFPVTNVMVAAALLDNRFVSLNEVDVFLEKLNTTRATFLSTYIKEMVNINEIPETITVAPSNKNVSLLHKLSKKHSIRSSQGTQDHSVEQECWRYITAADPTEPKDGDLLSFWNSKKEVYPYLSALAKAVLCVPATSTSSERAFSVAGLTVTAKRSRLNPTRINKIIFVNENCKVCS